MGVNGLLEFLSSHNDLTPWLAHWLGTYLVLKQDEAVSREFPKIYVPNSYSSGTTYLVSILSQMRGDKEKREMAIKIGCRITRAVSQILPEVLVDERGAPRTGNIELIDDLLFLIEALPCSEQTRQDLLVVTVKMYGDKRYRGWCQENIDVYNGLILAISSLVDENENMREWENWLARDLNVPDYTVAAFSVLLGINAPEAIRCHLCGVVKILGSAGISPANLLFGLAYRAMDKPGLEEMVISVLRGGNQHDAIKQFRRSKKDLKEV